MNEGVTNLVAMGAYNLSTTIFIIVIAALVMGVIILYRIFGGYFGVRLR
jgi:uncharacterized membrane protein YciS (DUF1049 family)